MARIRTIKPSFWADPNVAALKRDARLLLVGLISSADDEGRFLASTSAISGYVFPHDDLPPRTIRQWRDAIAASDVVEIYAVNGCEYGYFPKWKRHQRISKPQPSIIPPPPGTPPSPRNGSAPDRGMVPHPVADLARGGAQALGDRRQETGSVVTKSSQSQTDRNGVNDDGLDKIQKLTNGTKAHALKCIDFVLSKTSNDIANPAAYVLAAIRDEPDAYRYKRGNPKRGEECETHAGQWADACAGCAADRKATA